MILCQKADFESQLNDLERIIKNTISEKSEQAAGEKKEMSQ